MKVQHITKEQDLEKAFFIRKEVFVGEQGVPLEDEFDSFDQLDGQCEHILVCYDDNPVGTGRIRVIDGSGKLERICILPANRKLGLGKVIVAALENIAVQKGLSHVKLHGQTHAESFYQQLGYRTSSDVFMEDGIPHVLMVKELADR